MAGGLLGACLLVLPLGIIAQGVTAAPAGASTSSPAAVRVGRAPTVPAGATRVATLPPTAVLQVAVTLHPRDPHALADYASSVSTPGTSHYRHYLSVGQFTARFGPAPQAVAAVTRSLEDAGLHPGPVAADHLSIPVDGTAGQLSRAFSTGFAQYRETSGRVAYANTAAPEVAGAVAPYVQSVVGLDNLAMATPGSRRLSAGSAAEPAKPQVATGGPQPCTTAVTDGVSDASYTSDQVASAYGFSGLYDQGDLGAGQTVALYELQGFGAADIATYQQCYGTATSVTSVDVDGGPLADAGVGEADVDIEQVLSLAPRADILVYQGPNNGAGGYDTYSAIISQDVAAVVSTSWGLCEHEAGSAAAQAENVLFEEAAAQGQTVVAAAGDEGSEDCLGTKYAKSHDELAVDDPASQPYVTAAGGTQWSAAGTPPTEAAWNDGPSCCWGAGGGGLSALWTMPSYQSGAKDDVIDHDSSGFPCSAPAGNYCREVPDVSALAGPFPYLEYVSGSWGSWGGTSLAAPLWASLITLADALPSCGGARVGFANPALYSVASSDPSAFHDVTTGNNDLTGLNVGLYPAGVGYDMATGLGTPNGAALPAQLCAAAATGVAVVDPGNQSAALGAPVRLAVKATETNHVQTLTYGATGLPTGLSMDAATGVISGTPTAPGSFAVTVTATAANGGSALVSFSWSVSVAITSADSASATVGQPLAFTIVASGVPTSIKVTGTLPKGIKLVAAGPGTATLKGTPGKKDVPGSYPLIVRATYGKGKTALVATQSFTLVLT